MSWPSMTVNTLQSTWQGHITRLVWTRMRRQMPEDLNHLWISYKKLEDGIFRVHLKNRLGTSKEPCKLFTTSTTEEEASWIGQSEPTRRIRLRMSFNSIRQTWYSRRETTTWIAQLMKKSSMPTCLIWQKSEYSWEEMNRKREHRWNKSWNSRPGSQM